MALKSENLRYLGDNILTKSVFWRAFGGTFAGLIFSVCVLMILAWVFFSYQPGSGAIKRFLFLLSPPSNAELSKYDLQLLSYLQGKGIIVSPENILSLTMNYYDTLITIITIIMSVIGYIAFMYIRTSSSDHVEALVDKNAQKCFDNFVGSADFDNRLDQSLQQKFDEYSAGRLEIDEIEKTLEFLGDKVESLEQNLPLVQSNLSSPVTPQQP